MITWKKMLSFMVASSLMMGTLASCSSTGEEGSTSTNSNTTEDSSQTVTGDFVSPSTVKIICPYGVGGTADIIARKYALVAGQLFPEKNFIVENMTGGDGFAALTYYTEEAPQSTTDLIQYGYGAAYRHDLGVEFGTEVVDWNRDNVLPVACIDDRTWILYGTPGTDLEDVIDLATSGSVKMSGGNPLSDPHLALGALMALEGGTVMVVPYDGGATQKKALTDGEVDVFMGTTQAAQEDVEAGTLVPILAFSEEPFEGFIGPDGKAIEVPTVAGAEKSPALSPDLDHTSSILTAGGFIATRTGAHPDWIAEIEEITKAVWASEEFTDWMASIMLNKKETYGQESLDDVEEACAKALQAFELLK